MTSEQLQEIKDHVTASCNNTAHKSIIDRIKKDILSIECADMLPAYVFLGRIEAAKLQAEIDTLHILKTGTLSGLDRTKFLGLEVVECRRDNMFKVVQKGE